MKQWYRVWFLLAILWAISAIISAFQSRSGIVIGFQVFATILFAVLGIVQTLCDRKGERGRRAIQLIAILAIIVVVVVGVTLIVYF